MFWVWVYFKQKFSNVSFWKSEEFFENCSFPHTLSRGIGSIGTYYFTSGEITAIIGKLAVDYK